MNSESIDCRRIKIPVPEDVVVKPGEFAWDFDAPEMGGDRAKASHFLYICLPGEQHLSAIEVVRGAPGGNRVWGWDGNEDAPTIMPSVHLPGHWHGWLRAGKLVSV